MVFASPWGLINRSFAAWLRLLLSYTARKDLISDIVISFYLKKRVPKMLGHPCRLTDISKKGFKKQ